MSRLRELYDGEIKSSLTTKFGYSNVMQIPKLEKIVLNMRFGDCKDNPKQMESAVEELALISGQKPLVIKARKSVSNFKLRQGMNIAAKVTLRGERMYEFADRLLNIAIPRIRDFRGINPKSFDGRGNFSLGIKEQLIFPEIDYDKIEKLRGLDVMFVTTANTDEEGYELLKQLGMPFKQA